MDRITEQTSKYDNLEQKSVGEILADINTEDQLVANAVQKSLSSIEHLLEAMEPKFKNGGRLFYIGAGTSGRLGILDASEIPPTYGMSHDKVIGIIAGGDGAIRKAVEFAEDSKSLAKEDLEKLGLSDKDTVVGLAASGTTPYVIGGLEYANSLGALTSCITCNPSSPIASISKFPIEVIVGPEYVSGSTRMKSGTAQKMVLNMISTSLMIRIGRVKGNKMVNMQLNNQKLVERGIRFLVEELEIGEEKAGDLLKQHGSVKAVLNQFQ